MDGGAVGVEACLMLLSKIQGQKRGFTSVEKTRPLNIAVEFLPLLLSQLSGVKELVFTRI
jgi:hypothetical protein